MSPTVPGGPGCSVITVRSADTASIVVTNDAEATVRGAGDELSGYDSRDGRAGPQMQGTQA